MFNNLSNFNNFSNIYFYQIIFTKILFFDIILIMILLGDIEDIIYRNEENNYTVVGVNSNNQYITCVGKFPNVVEGQRVQMQGNVVKNNKYGEQFSVTDVKVMQPNTCEGIEKYLASGLIKGIGPITACAIVDKFKESTLEVIEFNPSLLSTVKGVSKQKAEQIAEAFMELKKMQNTVMFLQNYNISTNLAVKIYKTYLDKTETILSSNPYKLIEDVDGIGFLTADKIAQKLGIKPDSEFRIRAGIIYLLKESTEKSGNTYQIKNTLINSLEKLLKIENEDTLIDNILLKLEFEFYIKQFVYNDEQCIMLTRFYNIEKSIADKLLYLQASKNDTHISIEDEINEYERINKIKLHEKQRKAVEVAVNSGVSVITGGPGTGKTTIVKCILYCLELQRKSVLLLAPTGRAAKRLSESTRQEAKTIHRALDLDFKNGNGAFFTKNENDPLKQDVIIIDEMSMVDAMLMNSLLKAVKTGAQLILVGDKDQLPSVGAGNVLADILACEKINTVQLTEIYRQSNQSYIITNAHLINNGKMPILDNSSNDFFFENKLDPEEMLYTCVNLVTLRLPRFTKQEPSKIQVLAPLKAGVCGVDNLNKELQKIINPSKPGQPEIVLEHTTFRVGDKVMQIVNNYEQEWERANEFNQIEKGVGVFNGDIGNIYFINAQTGEVTVDFEDGRRAVYPKTEINQLVLSYAITIHKSQGSEFDVVVIPIISGASMILTRNLLYTAITRAKKMVVLVGSKYNIKRMVENNYTVKRYSMLKEFLINNNQIDLLFSSDKNKI